MSTNFYLHHDRCPHCDRSELTHIGKQVNGGFHFFSDNLHRSWDDWRKHLFARNPEDYVVNEYGDRFSVSEFALIIDMLDNRAVRESTFTQIASLRLARVPEDQFWIDSRGFLFVDYDFC